MRRIPRLAIALAVSAGCLPMAAAAELVVLTDGDFFKVQTYELRGERMRLELPSGGAVTLPLSRIERILEDEIPPEPEAVPVRPRGFSLGFHASQEEPETPYGQLIFRVAKEHDFNPALVAAMVRAESAFQPTAVSHKGARGLLQLMPATAERFGVGKAELFLPRRNLEAGVKYLGWLLRRYGEDLPRILAAYNAGEGTVDRYGGVPPYRETRDYIRRIYATLGLPVDGVAGLSES